MNFYRRWPRVGNIRDKVLPEQTFKVQLGARGGSELGILPLLQKDDGGIESTTCGPQIHHIRRRTANAHDKQDEDPHRSFELIDALEIRP